MSRNYRGPKRETVVARARRPGRDAGRYNHQEGLELSEQERRIGNEDFTESVDRIFRINYR
jgi:hypothetical protein